MQTILILGSNGFVGRSLKEYLSGKGFDVVGITHSELDLLDEVAVRRYFDSHVFDTVIHSAVWNPSRASLEDRCRETEMDIRMYLNVANCSDAFGRMIYFGSGAEYDKRRDLVNVKEGELEGDLWDKTPLPATSYGLAKRIIGRMIESSSTIYNLRIFGLYGKYEDYRKKFITGCCAKAVLGLPLTIRQNVYFDFLYIEDFCRMVERFINLSSPKYHTYNIVTGDKVDLVTLANDVKKASGKELPIYVCKDGFAKEYSANGDRLMDEIDYHKFVIHAEAISYLLEYFDGCKERLDKQALLYQ